MPSSVILARTLPISQAAIINARFSTMLVLVAVLTSAMAGAWLDYVLRTSQPLLSGEKCESTQSSGEEPLAA